MNASCFVCLCGGTLETARRRAGGATRLCPENHRRKSCRANKYWFGMGRRPVECRRRRLGSSSTWLTRSVIFLGFVYLISAKGSRKDRHDNTLEPGRPSPCSAGGIGYGCDPVVQDRLKDEALKVEKGLNTLEDSRVPTGDGVALRRTDEYGEEYVKKVREEGRKEEEKHKRESHVKAEQEQKKKAEESVKVEQTRKVEEGRKRVDKQNRDAIEAKYREAKVRKELAKEEQHKIVVINSRRQEFNRKKKTEHSTKRLMKNGKTGWLGCRHQLPGLFKVIRNSPLVRTTVDMGPLIANGEGIQFYQEFGGDSMGDFSVSEPRDAVTISINDPFEGHAATLKACKIDNTPITLEGYSPLKGTVAVLAGSKIARTSESWLGMIGEGDTVRISTEEFTVKMPITNEAITLSRPWPTNSGQKGDTPVSSDEVRYLHKGLVAKGKGNKLLGEGPDFTKQGGGLDAHNKSSTATALNMSVSAQKLLVEFDCEKLANGLCQAADVDSDTEEQSHKNTFVIDVYDDKAQCCTSQDVRSCQRGPCVEQLNPIAHIHVQVRGKRIYYRVEGDEGAAAEHISKRRALFAGENRTQGVGC